MPRAGEVMSNRSSLLSAHHGDIHFHFNIENSSMTHDVFMLEAQEAASGIDMDMYVQFHG